MQTQHERMALPVRDDGDPAGRLLDEFDTLVGLIEAAMHDMEAARATVAETDVQMEVLHASATLAAPGGNEAVRRAAVVLQLRDDPEYQTHAQTNRAARAELHASERRLTVAKLRLSLVKAALMVLIPAPPPFER